MGRMGDENGAEDSRAHGLEDHAIADAQRPWRPGLIPRHPLDLSAQLSAHRIEQLQSLGAVGNARLGAASRSVEFVLRQHHYSETRQLREVGRELADGFGFLVRTPVVLAVGNAFQHTPRRRQL